MRRADLLVVLGSDDPAYAPSRLATVCAAGPPVMVVASRDSVLWHRAREFSGVMCLAPGDEAGLLDGSFEACAPVLPESFRPDALAARECVVWDAALAVEAPCPVRGSRH
jgi:hypothetical protein